MINQYFLTDTSGKRSATLTAFVVGFLVVNLKLLISGLNFWGFQMETFSGVDYAATLAALGGIYILRRNKATIEKPEETFSEGE